MCREIDYFLLCACPHLTFNVPFSVFKNNGYIKMFCINYLLGIKLIFKFPIGIKKKKKMSFTREGNWITPVFIAYI